MDSGANASVAGINYVVNSTRQAFQVDLPGAGTYQVFFACGDISFAQVNTCLLFDGATSLTPSYSAVSTTSGQFLSSDGTVQTYPTAVTTGTNFTFATTTLYIKVGQNLGGAMTNSAIAYLRVVRVVDPTTIPPQFVSVLKDGTGLGSYHKLNFINGNSAAQDVTDPTQLNITIRIFTQPTDPGCTVTGDIPKIWFDTTTTTTASKKCMNVAGTVGWASF